MENPAGDRCLHPPGAPPPGARWRFAARIALLALAALPLRLLTGIATADERVVLPEPAAPFGLEPIAAGLPEPYPPEDSTPERRPPPAAHPGGAGEEAAFLPPTTLPRPRRDRVEGPDDEPDIGFGDDPWMDGRRTTGPVRLGGLVQLDTTAYSATAGPMQPIDEGGLAPPLSDAVNFRRARLRLDGALSEQLDWAAEYDFVNQINARNQIDPLWPSLGPLPELTELWLQARDAPWLGTLRTGNQKDPFGYEHLASCRTLDLMERSFCQDAFVGPFNDGYVPGIQAMNATADGRLAWQVGEFANTQAPFGFADFAGGSLTTGRLVWVPTWEDDGRRFLHLGLAGRTMQPRDGLVRFRSRGALWNGPPGPDNAIYADSGILAGSWQNMLGAEFVAGSGPWSMQAEYMGSWLLDAATTDIGPLSTAGLQPAPGTPLGTVFFQGGYVQASRFLTGEGRAYSLAEHALERPVPTRNLGLARGRPRGPGAWQAVARYDWLCLDDGEVHGGVLNGTTLGLNWLLTPRARIVFNYDFTWREYRSTPWANGPAGPVPVPSYDGSGAIHGFGTRLAFDW